MFENYLRSLWVNAVYYIFCGRSLIENQQNLKLLKEDIEEVKRWRSGGSPGYWLVGALRWVWWMRTGECLLKPIRNVSKRIILWIWNVSRPHIGVFACVRMWNFITRQLGFFPLAQKETDDAFQLNLRFLYILFLLGQGFSVCTDFEEGLSSIWLCSDSSRHGWTQRSYKTLWQSMWAYFYVLIFDFS